MKKTTAHDLAAALAAAMLVPAWAAEAPAAPAAAASAVTPGHLVMSDRRGLDCRPLYPEAAMRRNAQGTTRLRFYLDATGKPTAVGFLEHAGDTPEHRLLDLAAAKSLIHCPFEPGRDADGQPVPSEVDVSYTWKID